MKKIIGLILFIATLQSCRTINSTTYIAPKEAFVLGEGKHGSYKAKVKNIGNSEIEIMQVDKAGNSVSLGILKQGDKGAYPVARNMTVMFSNLGKQEGILKIHARGDVNLSMGFNGK